MAKKQMQENAEAENKAIVVPQTQPMAVQGKQRGFEDGVDQSDLIMPRAKLLQALSPELSDDNTELKKGQIINSITKEVLPAEFVPVLTFKEYMKFNPKNTEDPNFSPDHEPGALIWKTRDANDPRVKETQWGTDGERPTALAVLNFIALFPGQAMPAIISFAKTSYGAGKKLYSMTRYCKGDMFSHKYRLTSKKASGPAGEYYVLDVAAAGPVSPEIYAEAEGMWKDYAAMRERIQAHTGDDAE